MFTLISNWNEKKKIYNDLFSREMIQWCLIKKEHWIVIVDKLSTLHYESLYSLKK